MHQLLRYHLKQCLHALDSKEIGHLTKDHIADNNWLALVVDQ